mmetsp:Transcript_73373/g.194674  ORF Transcript_73373/g.194674 Transcript_73373/m.194674 type:complete len:205 (-) Transcript_73373:297-911(-)
MAPKVRTTFCAKRHASPNQAPSSSSVISSVSTLVPSARDPAVMPPSAASPRPSGTSASSERQMRGEEGDAGEGSAVSERWTSRRPCTRKTTSCITWPSSTTRSPGAHCTQAWALAISATNARGAARNSGNRNTTLLSSSRDSSLCTAGDSRPRRPAADAIWRSCRTRRRRSCSTRSWRSVDTPLRRISWSASWASWSASSWKTR